MSPKQLRISKSAVKKETNVDIDKNNFRKFRNIFRNQVTEIQTTPATETTEEINTKGITYNLQKKD